MAIKLTAHETDMKIPILNSIYNKNTKIKSKKLILILNNLNLNKVDLKKYPSVKILKLVPKKDTLFETLLVSANDELVRLFLKNKINYDDIYIKLNK